MSLLNEVEAKPIDGAIILNNDPNNHVPTYCLFHNNNYIKQYTEHFIKRSYELPYKWYYIVFKPFNSTYEKHLDFYKNKCFDHVRRKVGNVSFYLMTKEVNSKKEHVNMLCVSDRDLPSLLHEKKTNKYFIYAKECNDKVATYHYMIKESKQRYFYKYQDYIYYDAVNLMR